ncbi:MAG: hypothetical protein HYU59_15845 [Magnetospirillum gryphiswaldense]|uniref:hypothetical protein n=1 Tax=Magnetospirillum sp. 64-120 TaxID=1895778 RepID=UPI00092C615E|nr:hypothetical protein [Magnetospirillum sp. 64-120]MBI2242260.1 hypothetical protein [Magnetospirillum gryphiswaldense]OJX79629.1 MAG: hypothetical protein BGO92_14365 [Magnetospirillum sp. 64-120]
MADPFKAIAELQNAWFKAWLNSTQSMGHLTQHLLEMQQKMLSHAVKYQRDHIEIATGPSLTDKYGKRAHDIDPERDV